MRKTASILLVLLLPVIAVSSLEIGEMAASFANPDLEGKYLLSKNVVGKGWIIVDFFATWCEPCKKEILHLEEMLETYGEDELTVLVFATDREGGSVVKPYFAENPTTLRVVLDRYGVTSDRYGVETIPTVFLLNPDGEIVVKGVGYSEEVIEEMKALLGQT